MAAFAAPLIGAGISALTGLFGAKKPQTTTTTSSSTTNPVLDANGNALENQFADDAINMDKAGGPDLSGYTANGLQQINNGANIKQKLLQNTLASRGLSFSPAAATATGNADADRLAQSSQFLSSVPLLKRQFQQQNLQQLMTAFGIIPKGQTSSGTSTQTGSTNPVASTLSGAGQGIFAALPYLTRQNNGFSNLPGMPAPGNAFPGTPNSAGDMVGSY